MPLAHFQGQRGYWRHARQGSRPIVHAMVAVRMTPWREADLTRARDVRAPAMRRKR